MVLEGPTAYATIKASLPQLKADKMKLRRTGQVHAAHEAYAKH
jgi:hypothetical protein